MNGAYNPPQLTLEGEGKYVKNIHDMYIHFEVNKKLYKNSENVRLKPNAKTLAILKSKNSVKYSLDRKQSEDLIEGYKRCLNMAEDEPYLLSYLSRYIIWI